MSKPRKRYDYMDALYDASWTYAKAPPKVKRVLRKLVRDAVRERQKIHPTVHIDASDMIAERLVP